MKAAQRARLAALNALAIASPGPGPEDADIAALFPKKEERSLGADGRAVGVRTVSVMRREAVISAGAIHIAAAKQVTSSSSGGQAKGGDARSGRSRREKRVTRGSVKEGSSRSVGFGGMRGSGSEGGLADTAKGAVKVEVPCVVEELLAVGRYEEAADAVLCGLDDQVSRDDEARRSCLTPFMLVLVSVSFS